MATFDRTANQAALDKIFGAGVVQAGEGRGDAALKAGTPQQRYQYQELRRAAGDTAYDVTPLGAIDGTVPMDQLYQQQSQNPVLPTGATLTPVLQKVQEDELLDPNKYKLGTAPTITAPTPITAPTITAAQTGTTPQVNVDDILAYLNGDAGQIDPTKVGSQTPQATAQQGEVSDLSTIQGQLSKLFADVDSGEVPLWASAAYQKANSDMARRGISASSISAAAITQAYMQSALPIAASDAATYFAMDMKNLDNRQQTELENVKMRQQSLLTDVAIENAAKQFNASSALQTQQFTATLISQITEQNAARKAAMEQFNVSEKNKIEAANAGNTLQADLANQQTKLAVDKFNADLTSQREIFNATMASTIDQANVVWRRSINTQNNAAVNASNATNVQNLFGLSQVAQNNLWQAYRDYASWNFTASQTQAQMAFNAAQAANNMQFNADVNDQQMNMAAGQAIFSIFSKMAGF